MTLIDKASARTAVADLSITERAALTSGAGFFTTEAAAGRTRAVLNDGPHGVRQQEGSQDHLGIAPSEPATCFPPGAGLAQTWDKELVERVGAALGREARHAGADVLLGPAVNIKRDPRGGRNFEYYSEDPLIAGVLGAAWVKGLQSEGVGASPKHFAANNAETDRMRSDSVVDDRALREIYLKVFERIVTEAQPWTIMSAYNKLNGTHCAANRWLLHDVLRGEWGFDGLVVSDWGAVSDRAASVAAGNDLAMPSPGPESDTALARAVETGEVSTEALDEAAANVLRLLDRAAKARTMATPADYDAHHELAREAAARSIVLLKNDGGLLPLEPQEKVAVIGRFAATPRYQGGGSSHITPTRVDVPLEQIEASAAAVTYVEGYPAGIGADAVALREEAVAAAAAADVAVVFLAVPDGQESEGFDKDSIELPAEQIEVLRQVAVRQPRTVAVIAHGGTVRLADVAELAPAILDGGLLGQGGGAAVADVLYGRVNPSGRLTETIPVRLEDVPAYGNFPGENSRVLYGESIYVGYRWYDAREAAVTFPFGHGLSYTTFEYSDLTVTATPDGLTARVRVANTGERDGREVVQLYVGKPESAVRRAPRELKAFETVLVGAGETVAVELTVPRSDLAYWETRTGSWIVEDGDYEIAVGASSRDLHIFGVVTVSGDDLRIPLSRSSTLGEAMAHPVAGPILREQAGSRLRSDADSVLGMDTARMAMAMPLKSMAGMGGMSIDQLDALIAHANAA